MAQVNKQALKSESTSVNRQASPITGPGDKSKSTTTSAAQPPQKPTVKVKAAKHQEGSPSDMPEPERVLSKKAIKQLEENRQRLMTQKPERAGWAKWRAQNAPLKRVLTTATTMLKYFPAEVHTIDAEQAKRFIQGMSEGQVHPLSERDACQVLDGMVVKGTIFQSFAAMRCAQQIFDIVIEEGRNGSLDGMHARLTACVFAENATIALFMDAVHADAFLATLLQVVTKFNTRILKSDSDEVRRLKKARIADEVGQLRFVLCALGRRGSLTAPTLAGRKTAEQKQAKRRLTRSMETDSQMARAWTNLDTEHGSKKEKRKSMQLVGSEATIAHREPGKAADKVATSATATPGKVPGLLLNSTGHVRPLVADAGDALTDVNVNPVVQSPGLTADTCLQTSPSSPRGLIAAPQRAPKKLDASASGTVPKKKAHAIQTSSPVKLQASVSQGADSPVNTTTANAREKRASVKIVPSQEKLLELLNDPTEAGHFVNEFGQDAICAMRLVVVAIDDGKAPNFEVKIRRAKLEPQQQEALRAACRELDANQGYELGSEVQNELLVALRAIGQDLKRMGKNHNT